MDPSPRNHLSRSGLEGRTLGPYTIQALIAEGGMGSVHLAFHRELGRQVALKTLRAADQGSPEETARFINEARALARIRHPNVVPLYDAGSAGGLCWLAMEYVRGRTLHEVLRERGSFPEHEAVAVVRAVADGLRAAHRLGILHRDLKPANILLDESGVPRLTDFGLARTAGSRRLTQTGVVVGTPNYMAPEQARGDAQQDVRVDVYGLCAVLYELLTGRPPFAEASQLATLEAVVSKPPPPPRSLRRDLSPEVEGLVLAGLEKDPGERIRDMDTLARELDRLLGASTSTSALSWGGPSSPRRALSGSLLLAAGVLAGAGLVVLVARSGVLGRNRSPSSERLFAQAERWWEEERSVLRARCAADPLENPQAIAADLSPASVLARAEVALGVDHPAERAVVRQALEGKEGLEAALAPLRARLAWRRARTAEGDERLALLAEAACEGAGEEAARAHLALAREARRGTDPLAHALARRSLEPLVAAGGPLAPEAAETLAWLRAAALDFSGAAASASAVAPASDEVRLLAALAGALEGRSAAPRVVADGVLRAADGPLLLAGEGDELVVFRARDGHLEPLRHWTLPAGRRLLRLFSGTRAQRPICLAIVRGPGRRLELRWLDPAHPEGTLSEPPALVVPQAVRFADAARGDFDGDGRADLVVLSRLPAAASFLFRGGLETARVFPVGPGVPSQEYRFATAGAIDLDGDGRDELLLGSSGAAGRWVTVWTFDPREGAFRPRGRTPVGRVVRLARLSQDRVLAVVDAGDERILLRDPEPRWLGRDGLYLLGPDGAGRLSIQGRWTVGEDAPLSVRERRAVGAVAGLVFPLAGEEWILRSWRELPDQALHLDCVPLAALAGPENPRPRLSLVCPAPPPWRPGPAAYLHGLGRRGRSGVLLGGWVFGLGASSAAAEPNAREPALERNPSAVLLRYLYALGRPEAARKFAERQAARAAGTRWERFARRTALEARLARGRKARRAALRAFARGDTEAGRAAWSTARQELQRAASEAGTLAAAGLLGRVEASEKAALAFEAAGEPARALELLEALPDAPVGVRSEAALRLAEARARLRSRPLGPPLSLSCSDGSGPGDLLPTRPLRVRFDPDGMRLFVSGACLDGALAEVRCDPSAWAVEAEVEALDDVWQGEVQVGLFEGRSTKPARASGFVVSLWSVERGGLRVQAIHRGKLVGPAFDWPRFGEVLRVRAELSPHAYGGVVVRLTVQDARGRLLFCGEGEAPQPPPLAAAAARRVGVWSPRGGDRDSLTHEQPGFALEGEFRLRSLRIRSHGPCARSSPPRLLAAHALLAAGDAEGARRAYSDLLDAGNRWDTFAARWHRAFARARAGDPRAANDLIAAVRANPYEAVLRLEDLASPLVLENAPDRDLVARSLALLGDPSQPVLLRLIAAQLTGNFDRWAEPERATDEAERKVRYYLSLRRATQPEGVRRRFAREYDRASHRGRLPRAIFPQVLPSPPEEPAGADLARLLAPRNDRLEAFRDAMRAWWSFPERIDAPLRLAELFLQAGQPGAARGILRPLLRRGLDPQDRRRVLLWLARSHYALDAREEFFAAAEELVRSGLSPAGLSEFAPRYGRDPRFRALLGEGR